MKSEKVEEGKPLIEVKGLRIAFDAPLRRIAPGQQAVGYDGEGFVLFAGTVQEA